MINKIISFFIKPKQEDIEMVKIIEKAVAEGLRVENTSHGGFLISRDIKEMHEIYRNYR